MKRRVREIIAANTGLDLKALGDDGDLWRAGMASKAAVRVMLEIEEEFQVEFPPESMSQASFATVAAITAAVEPLVAAASTGARPA
jgi:acyl carrier protein